MQFSDQSISIFAELPSKIYVNQMPSDARAAAAEGDGGNEGDYDEDDEDDRHGIFFFILIVYLINYTGSDRS